ncbi:MAG: hypothetical protein ACI8PZ_003730 [Myxococcota bacterium]|jgi:hypothetical protein
MVQWLSTEGTVGPVLVTLAVLLGGAATERIAVALRIPLWFLLAVPLGAEPLPIPDPPTAEEGEGAGVAWARLPDGRVLWWATATGPLATGLHGVARLARSRHGVHVRVSWAPPLTPIVGALWIALLGAFRGEATLTGPLAGLLVGALVLVYHRGAIAAAGALRWALSER